jgi:hypothetical protein
MCVSCERRVLSGIGLCGGLITRPAESTECGVPECDCEASMMRRPSLTKVCCAMETKNLGTSYHKWERGETVG